jgi:PAS domain S-box-containing protein/putative nucleotidyltransferase with HDIG domain
MNSKKKPVVKEVSTKPKKRIAQVAIPQPGFPLDGTEHKLVEHILQDTKKYSDNLMEADQTNNEKWAAELVIANKELAFQNEENKKRAEETIRNLARFPSENPNPVLRISRDGNLLYANEAAFLLLPEWELKLGEPAPEELKGPALEVLEAREVQTIEIPCGKRIFSISLALAPKGKDVNLYARDITKRKQAEEELKKSEGMFRAIFNNVSTGMFIVDLKAQKFFMCNTTCAKMLGYPQEEFLNLDIADLHPVEDMPFINEQIKKFSRGEGGIRSDILFKRKNGSVFASDLSPALLTIADKKYLLISFIDITERKEREEEIQSLTDELSVLYQLSRALANANDIENVIALVNRHAVESMQTTFACIALMEEGDLVPRAVYSLRKTEHDFIIGNRQPITALPFCQHVLDKNESVVLQTGNPDVSSLERATLMFDFALVVCLVPLWAGDDLQRINQALGLLILGEAREEKREPFTPDKIRLARSIGDQAAVAIHRMLLHEHAGRRLEHLASMSEIDRTIASSFDLSFSLQMILKHVIEQLEVDAADVLVFNTSIQALEFAAGRGFRSPRMEGIRVRLGEGQAGQAMLKRKIIQITDVAASEAVFAYPDLLRAENVAAYFAVPLITKGQVKGVLEICNRTTLKPNEEWLDFLNTLAGQAAIAIDNVQMFDNLQRSTDELELAYDATIAGWSRAMDLRDKETEGHTLRVTDMTIKMARTFGLSEAELVQVRWGALLHDIGKMGVPDGILLKPGPLTDEEWVAMKKHPTFAYEMLLPIRYLHSALDIPYCHHEKWDGTGYPRGLKGEQIPLVARIFAVVDVYDALISERPYRKAWQKEKVLEHIKAESGKQFDPQAVKAFLEMKEVADDQ